MSFSAPRLRNLRAKRPECERFTMALAQGIGFPEHRLKLSRQLDGGMLAGKGAAPCRHTLRPCLKERAARQLEQEFRRRNRRQSHLDRIDLFAGRPRSFLRPHAQYDMNLQPQKT